MNHTLIQLIAAFPTDQITEQFYAEYIKADRYSYRGHREYLEVLIEDGNFEALRYFVVSCLQDQRCEDEFPSIPPTSPGHF